MFVVFNSFDLPPLWERADVNQRKIVQKILKCPFEGR